MQTAYAAGRWSLPHARGGVSGPEPAAQAGQRSSPRPWGCFRNRLYNRTYREVFPTPVGVFLIFLNHLLIRERLPHARGGVSSPALRIHAGHSSSPRPWGCFFCSWQPLAFFLVFPTPVGVFLKPLCRSMSGDSLPHARGGVSKWFAGKNEGTKSSPRPWGCFFHAQNRGNFYRVFPTPVGVFPIGLRLTRTSFCLPHARGGVSRVRLIGMMNVQSSPRPWGCFSNM